MAEFFPIEVVLTTHLGEDLDLQKSRPKQRWWLPPGEHPDWEFLHPHRHWKRKECS